MPRFCLERRGCQGNLPRSGARLRLTTLRKTGSVDTRFHILFEDFCDPECGRGQNTAVFAGPQCGLVLGAEKLFRFQDRKTATLNTLLCLGPFLGIQNETVFWLRKWGRQVGPRTWPFFGLGNRAAFSAYRAAWNGRGLCVVPFCCRRWRPFAARAFDRAERSRWGLRGDSAAPRRAAPRRHLREAALTCCSASSMCVFAQALGHRRSVRFEVGEWKRVGGTCDAIAMATLLSNVSQLGARKIGAGFRIRKRGRLSQEYAVVICIRGAPGAVSCALRRYACEAGALVWRLLSLKRVRLHANSPTCAFWLARQWVAVGVNAVSLRLALVVLLRAKVAAFALAVPFQRAFLTEPAFASRGLARSPLNAFWALAGLEDSLRESGGHPVCFLAQTKSNTRTPECPRAAAPKRLSSRTA
jgi:hypothetical protein